MRFLISTNIREAKGLFRDAEILSGLLTGWGHAVETFDFRGEPINRADVTIHLEHVEPRHLEHSGRNWYIPNAEWHMEGAQRATEAGRFERVLCKTRQAVRVLSPLTDRAEFLGFESRDRLLPDVARERAFMHAPGQSDFRGTEAVLGAFQHGCAASLVLPRGMAEPEYRREQNRCRFHLCPSEIEGWGHGIHEALSVGAIVVTTDGPPMNEIEGVTYRIPTKSREPFRLVELMKIDRKGVQAALNWCLGLSEDEIVRLSTAARTAFETERADFRARLLDIVGIAEVAA